jgi:hypothetical protein
MGALGNPAHERFCQALHKRLWAGEKAVEARCAVYREIIYSGDNPDSVSLQHNARKLCGQKKIRARLAELADYSAKLAGIDASWALVELMSLYGQIKAFNLNDFLGPPDEVGNRYYDFRKATPAMMALLSEYTIEETDLPGIPRALRKVRFKGPEKPKDLPAIIERMAKIAGWEAPKKTSLTDPEGEQLTLEKLVGASMMKREPAGASE